MEGKQEGGTSTEIEAKNNKKKIWELGLLHGAYGGVQKGFTSTDVNKAIKALQAGENEKAASVLELAASGAEDVIQDLQHKIEKWRQVVNSLRKEQGK